MVFRNQSTDTGSLPADGHESIRIGSRYFSRNDCHAAWFNWIYPVCDEQKGSWIIHDQRNEHGEDEGIFGDDQDHNFGGVSIQNSYQEGYDEPEDIDDYYRDMAATGGILA